MFLIQRTVFAIGAAACLVAGGNAFVQNTNSAATNAPRAGMASQAGSVPAPKLSAEELETKFQAMLTNATLAGRWCSLKDGQLGSDQEDKYTIQGINKISGDMWMVHAHIQYGQRDVVAPIPVQVKWAGDTPVLSVDNLRIPGGGTYTARVLFYDNTYSGTWSGGTHGGLLHGVVTHPADARQ